MNKVILIFFVALLPVCVRAEIYKCGETWQNSPCKSGQAEKSIKEVKRKTKAKSDLAVGQDAKAHLIDSKRYILFVPSGLTRSDRRPLIIALSPSANARSLIKVWRSSAEKRKWLIFASKTHRNKIPIVPVLDKIVQDIRDLERKQPIDFSKIIASGFSGGAMSSHTMSFLHPGFVAGIVVNTGMMSQQQVRMAQKLPAAKLAVFLASPKDFRYQEMKRDYELLDDRRWKLKWIEFKGGHKIAPRASYAEAAQWLESQL